MNNRFNKINHILSEFSTGNFDKRLELSPNLDEIDAFMAGINMLGEELKTTTISKNYFNDIFNSVSDMVFVLNAKGEITDINRSVTEKLGHPLSRLQGVFIDNVIEPKRRPFYAEVIKEFKNDIEHVFKDSFFVASNTHQIPVAITASNLYNDKKCKLGLIITAKDTTLKIQTENLIIRTIIDTQEKERLRLAKDIHDSLGQQLSAIKFYISTSAELSLNDEQKSILTKSSQALTRVLSDMRNICFNLMPETLEEFGLIEAVKELCNQIYLGNQIKIKISVLNLFPNLHKEIEIDLYRIVQEFINNAIKHGNASIISIKFRHTSNHVKLMLEDNGHGFNPDAIHSKGMGLQNIHSRTKSHNGVVKLDSEINKGTKLTVLLPIKK